MRLVFVECVDERVKGRERERTNRCVKNDPLEPIGIVMCSSSSGPHCQFITGRYDSSPSVVGFHNKGVNIVQITHSSGGDFWSTTSGVNSLDFVDKLYSLLASMTNSSQDDRMEKIKLGPTTQSSMQDSEHQQCDYSNDGQRRLDESGFVVTMMENNPYWEAKLNEERVLQVDVYDGHPEGAIFLSLSNRKENQSRNRSTGPVIQKLDEEYDLKAPGHTWIELLPDECEKFHGNSGTSEDGTAKHRVCHYYVEHYFNESVGKIRLRVEGFGQLRLGRVDVWVSRTNGFNRFLCQTQLGKHVFLWD